MASSSPPTISHPCENIAGPPARGPDCSAAQVPERTRQPEVSEDRLGFIERLAPPRRAELVRIPDVRELPAHGGRHRAAPWEITRPAPSVDVLLRPEEQHRASRVANILPP